MPVDAFVKTFPHPSLAEMKEVFQVLKESTYEGVKGVMCFDSGNPGPVVGITVMTHGNEPAGLAPLWFFMNQEKLEDHLLSGKILFVLNNIEAAGNYFDTLDAPIEDKIATRFIDINMNRLPTDLAKSTDPRYEVRRSQELLPIWQQFDYGLDIHSASIEMDPLLVAPNGFNFDLTKGFPVKMIASKFPEMMQDNMAFSYYGSGMNSMLVEVGSHEDSRAAQRSIVISLALLSNLNLVDKEIPHYVENFQHYEVTEAIFFPCESYKTVEIFPNYSTVKKGQLLAIGDGEPIYSPIEGHALMCFATGKPPNIAEEALFLSQPVQTIKLD